MASEHHDESGIYGTEMGMFKELNCLSSPAIQHTAIEQPLGASYRGICRSFLLVPDCIEASLKHLDKLAGYRGSRHFVVVVLSRMDS